MDFAGWLMPVQYTSIVTEHLATRQQVTLFDVSHMGRFQITGPAAVPFLETLLTRSTSGLAEGRIRYSLVCQQDGGILDDVLVYRLAGAEDPRFLLVVNAGNREKIWQWINSYADKMEVDLEDQTLDTAMIAVQGPAAVDLLEPVVETSTTEQATGPSTVNDLGYYCCRRVKVCGVETLVSRTGYTGEDGFELILDTTNAMHLWSELLERGQDVGAIAAGLGARDTLRLEAAMPLYGHELSEEINPYQAGLGFAVDLKGRAFTGHEALAGFSQNHQQACRVGISLESKRVPREGYQVLTVTGDEVGNVTSGTFSPTFERPIAMAYVEPAYANLKTELLVNIRGTQVPASIVKLPFYQRKQTTKT